MSFLRSGYTILSWASSPVVSGYLKWRSFKGQEDKARLSERKGFTNYPRPQKALLWIHAVSVGESMVALALGQTILKQYPHIHILLTTTTTSSAKLLEKRLPKNIIHQFCPVDTPQAVHRFLDHWKPDLAIWVESEFWPNLIHGTQSRGIPTLLLNGRISRQSFSNWKKFRSVIAPLLARFDLCAVQSEEQATFFKALGALNLSVTGNAKIIMAPLKVDTKKYKAFKKEARDRSLWLIASSHPGEEKLAFEVHKILKKDHPDLLTIVVPRHIKRATAVQQLALNEELSVALQTETASFEGIEVYIADTLGELSTFYALSSVAFMGATFVPKGGHNPIEAAQLGTFVLHGPHTFNNPHLYDTLASLGLSQQIQDAHQLAQALRPWLKKQKTNYVESPSLKTYREEKQTYIMKVLAPYLQTLRDVKE